MSGLPGQPLWCRDVFWRGSGKGGDPTFALPGGLFWGERGSFFLSFFFLSFFFFLSCLNVVPLVTLCHEAFALPIYSGPAPDALGAGASSCWAGSWGDAEALL